MPIEPHNNQFVVMCVNRELADHRAALVAPGQVSTMQIVLQWHALTHVTPPMADAPVHFNSNAGIPVRSCICQVCGYIELYSGIVQNPQVWGPPNG
jgi:hypothetical protein